MKDSKICDNSLTVSAKFAGIASPPITPTSLLFIYSSINLKISLVISFKNSSTLKIPKSLANSINHSYINSPFKKFLSSLFFLLSKNCIYLAILYSSISRKINKNK